MRVIDAATTAGVHVTRAYKRRNTEAFAKAWDDALNVGTEALETASTCCSQSSRLVGPGILGNLHPVHRGRTRVSGPQERTTAAADLASLRGRTQADVFVYALWKTLDHLSKRAGLQTLIHKHESEVGDAGPQPRPMSPETILRTLAKVQIGDILLETTTGAETGPTSGRGQTVNKSAS
jgi:hypothetical protein